MLPGVLAAILPALTMKSTFLVRYNSPQRKHSPQPHCLQYLFFPLFCRQAPFLGALGPAYPRFGAPRYQSYIERSVILVKFSLDSQVE
jgi:hypothetical protein